MSAEPQTVDLEVYQISDLAQLPKVRLVPLKAGDPKPTAGRVYVFIGTPIRDGAWVLRFWERPQA